MRDFLSEDEHVSLRSQHRLERDRRVADRIEAALLSDQGWTYQKIGAALLLDEETISQHVEDYRDLPPYSPNLNPTERLWKVMMSASETMFFLSQQLILKHPFANFLKKLGQTLLCQWSIVSTTIFKELSEI